MADKHFPEMPAELRVQLPVQFWYWWQAFRSFVLTNLFTTKDITVLGAGSGIVMTSPNGAVTRRIYLKNDGTVGVEVV